MKTRTNLILCVVAVLALVAVQPAHAALVYWDINGVTAGAGGATPAGTWDGANTYWNSVAAGTGATAAWLVGDTAVFAAGTDATGIYTVTVGTGTTQDIGSLTFEEGTVTLSGGVALRLVANSIVDVASARTATVSTVISEDATPRTLTKTSAGTLVLSGDNSYTGTTTISGGVLNIRHANALGTTAGGTTVSSGFALELQGGITVGAETLSLNGTGISSGGALRNISGDNIYGGLITLAGASRINSDTSGTTLTISNVNIITGATFGLTVGGAGNTSIASIIGTTTGGLTKDGAGTLTLSGVNTYTGTTLVSAGTLAYGVSDAISTGAVTVNGATAILALGANNDTNIGTVTLTAGSITGSGTLTSTGGFTMNNAAATSVTANLAGGVVLNKSAAGVLALSGTNTYTGTTTISGGTLRANDGTGLPTGSLLTISAGVFETSANLVRTGGAAAGNMNITAGTSGFSARGGAVQVAFGTLLAPTALTWGIAPFVPTILNLNAATADNTIDFKNDISLVNSARTVQVDANVATMSGVLSSTGASGGLTKTGAGKLVLPVANSYTGTTLVSAGTLAYGVSEAIFTGAVTVNGATAILDLGAYNDTNIGTVTLTAGSITGSGTLTSTGGFTMNNAAAAGVTANLAGGVALTKSAAGVLALSGANTYTGTTTISGGTLRANDGTGLPTGSFLTISSGVFETSANLARTGGVAAGNMNITAGTSGFSANGGPVQVAFGTLLAPTALTWGVAPFVPTILNLNAATADNTIDFKNAIDLVAAVRTVQVDANVATMSGVLSGVGGGLTKTGGGTLVLSNTNTYTGTTLVSAGTLAYGVSDAIFTGAVTVNGATAILALGANNDTNIGLVTLTAGSITGSGTLTSTTSPFTMNNAAATSVTANLAGGVALTKSAAGVLTLSGTNIYTGTTTVSGGTLRANDGTGLPTGSLLTISAGVFETSANLVRTGGVAAGNMNITAGTSGFSARGGAVQVAFGTLLAPTPLTWAIAPFQPATLYLNAATADNTIDFKNAIDLVAAVRTVQVDANVATMSGVLSGVGGGLTKTGGGALVLSGANTYTGTTTLTTGTVRAGVASVGAVGAITSSAIGTGGLTFGGGGLSSDGATARTILNAVTFTGNATLGDAVNTGTLTFSAAAGLGAAVRTLTVNSEAQFDGIISNGGITKAGTATLTLAGANTYASATTVNAGTLTLSGSPTGNSAVTVNPGATLRLDYAANDTTKINDAAVLTLSGGTLTLNGGTHTEVVASTTLTAVTASAGTVSNVTRSSGSAVLRMNAITRGARAMINFGAAGIADTDTVNTNGILGAWATVGGADWATNSTNAADGPITAYAAYTLTSVAGITAGNYLNNNIDVDNSAGTLDGVITPNSLRFNTTAANTVALAAGTSTISSGGILVTGAVGNNLSTIAGGSLTGPASGDLTVIQNNTSNGLTIGSTIANNTATALIKVGAGLLTLTASGSSITGEARVNAGSMTIPGGATLATGAASIGYAAADSGSVTVTGAGSAWHPTGSLEVGNYGDNNTLTISAGGHVHATDHIHIGTNSGADNNTITVTGAGSTLVAEDYLEPGRGGAGNTLNIEQGATATCYLFWSSGGSGNPSTSSSSTVKVTDPGSSLSVSSTWDIADRGTGNQFRVLNGGVVNMAGGAGYVGYWASGVEVLVDGTNSVFNTAAVDWGNQGAGINATVSNSGRWNSNDITFRNNNNLNLNSGGELNVTTLNLAAAGGRLNFNGGRLIAKSSGSLVSGSGLIDLIGPAYIFTDYNRTIANVIYDTGSLTKEGAGILTLSGNNTYTGLTTVSAGTLTLGRSGGTIANTAPVTVSGGILDVANAETVGAVALSSGTISGVAILTGSSYSLTNTGLVSAVLAGSGALTKTGAGTATLSNVNTYSGNTTISNGTLALTGSIASSPIIDVASLGIFDVSGVTGGYTLGAAQTLKGYGTVIGPMTAAGTVSPGSSTGTLTVTGNATLNGTFKVDVETGGASDLLAVTGNLVLGGASILSIVDTLQLNLAMSPYTIATYTGTQTGTFASTNLPTPSLWTVNYGDGSNDAITLTPEPATLALMGLGGLGLILSRKRR